MSDTHIRYDFEQNSTSIIYIEYDAEKTFRKTTTTVEELKGKSTFVPKHASGRVFKYENIWVGDEGGGLPTSISNGSIGFRVEKSWINGNNVNESLITLQWYNQSNQTWEPLYTKKVGEDSNYSYFTSAATGFSFFAITEIGGTAQIGLNLSNTFLGGLRNMNISMNRSGNNNRALEVKEAAKILMAVALPVFMILVGYLMLKKKI